MGTLVNQDRTLTMDEILLEIGQFGRFQILLIIALGLLIFPDTYQGHLSTFVSHEPNWRCTNGSSVCKLTEDQQPSSLDYKLRCSLNRSEWEFVEPKSYSTVTEWDQICEQSFLSEIGVSLIFVGMFIGAFVWGILSDRFGRKKTFLAAYTMTIMVSVIRSFSSGPVMYMVMRVFQGFFKIGCGTQLFILAMEYVGPKYRAGAGTSLWMFYAVAMLVLDLKAYYMRNWRILELAVSVPYLVLLLMLFYIPESARWMLVHRRYKGLRKILENIALLNSRSVHDFGLPEVELFTSDQHNFRHHFRGKVLRITVLISYVWFTVVMVYWGVSYSTDSLGGNLYRDYALTALIEFPSYILTVIFCDKWGRKATTTYSTLVSSISLISVALMPPSAVSPKWVVARIAVGMIGRGAITIASSSIYVWVFEFFPTAVRSRALGLCLAMGRLGGFVCPFIVHGLLRVHAVLPYSVLGGFVVLSTVACCFLPETCGMDLVDQIPLNSSIRRESTEISNLEEHESLLY